MAEPLIPTGFWSYTSSDDENSSGRLSQLRVLVTKALQLEIGQRPKVAIFQDIVAIPKGAEWERALHAALDQSSFMIVILTPAFLQSEYCCKEILHFHTREAAIGRKDLIFPFEYVDTAHVNRNDKSECYDPAVFDLLRGRQVTRFAHLRFQDVGSPTVAAAIGEFAHEIKLALRRGAQETPFVPRDVPAAAEKPSESAEHPAARTAPVPDDVPFADPEHRATQTTPLPDPIPTAVAPPPAAPPAPWWRRQGWAVLAVAALLAFIVYERHEAGGWPFASTVHKPAPVVVAQIPTPTVPPPTVVPPPPVPVVAPPPAPPAKPVAPQPLKELRDCDTCPEMVLVPAGTFQMGVPKGEGKDEGIPDTYDDDARPVHPVTIGKRFYLGKYPITVGEYKVFARADDRNHDPGDAWTKPGFPQDDRHPVVNVSFVDATKYLEWLSKKTNQAYRLPSESEWEYAARAKTTTARYWGDAWDNAGKFTVPRGKTAPVDAMRKNEFDLSDMLGHVWQWTEDCWHDSYKGNPPTDGSAWKTGGDCGRRLLRGGSWDIDPGNVRAGYRLIKEPASRASYVGFRAARTLSPP